MITQKKIRFSAININHAHIYSQTDALLEAGAEMVSFFAKEPELAAPYAVKYPQRARPNLLTKFSGIKRLTW